MNKLAKRFRGLLPIVVDIETGGFDCDRNPMLEIAVVFMEYQDGILVEQETFHEHIIPEPLLEIDPEALAFTGIIPDHPFRNAVAESAMLTSLQKKIEFYCKLHKCTRAVLVGHNGQFDLSFIQKASIRHDIGLSLHRFLVFDTATLSAALLAETVLARAVRRAGMFFDEKEAHSALYDAQMTSKLFAKLIHRADASLR
jgi:ribonuclease T